MAGYFPDSINLYPILHDMHHDSALQLYLPSQSVIIYIIRLLDAYDWWKLKLGGAEIKGKQSTPSHAMNSEDYNSYRNLVFYTIQKAEVLYVESRGR